MDYLSPRGRIARRTYVLGVLAPLVVLGAILSAILPGPAIVAWVLFAPLYWAYFAGFARRLQDFGLPGLPISALIVLGLWLDVGMPLVFPAWLETYLFALLGVGALFAGSTAGELGTNRYGPDPLAGAEDLASDAPSAVHAAATPGDSRA